MRLTGTSQMEVGEKPMLTISCAGNLDVRGDSGSSVRISGDDYELGDSSVRSSGNLRVRVPHGTSVTITGAAGNVRVKTLQGNVEATEIVAGDFDASSLDGSIMLIGVAGSARIKHVGGSVTIAKAVHGDLSLKHSGGLMVERVHGGLSVKHTSGGVEAQEVMGDAVVRYAPEDVKLMLVHGDAAVGHLGGSRTEINCHDDIKIMGPLSPGKHNFDAKSTISMRYPKHGSVAISATAPVIVNRLSLDHVKEESDGKMMELQASHGDGDAVVNLTAAEKIVLRSSGHEGAHGDSSGYEGNIDFEFDFAGLGERISAEINARMEEVNARAAEINTQIAPEVSAYAERALRKAQAAIDRAVSNMEREVERAEKRAHKAAERAARRPKPPTPPTPPRPPSGMKPPAPPSVPVPPPPPVDTSAEQMKILKMLEDGKITVDEANGLLAALG